MAQKQLTVEKIVAIVKEKWSLFGVSTLIVFLLQLLSSKVLLAVFLGLIFTIVVPSEALKKLLNKSKRKLWQK